MAAPGPALRTAGVAAAFAALVAGGGAGFPLPRPGPSIQERAPAAAFDAFLFERALCDLVNRERSAAGLAPLRVLDDLAWAARVHSREMAAAGILTHDSSDGLRLIERLARAGVRSSAAGENAAKADVDDPAGLHRALMDSPRHRAILLGPAWEAMGVGAARDGATGEIYVTEDFVRLARLPPARALASGRECGTFDGPRSPR